MNKKLMFLCAFICFFTFGSAKANTLNSIDTTVYIDENGNGRVTEVWQLNANEGTESYHSFGNLEGRSISDFTVSMDGQNYTSQSFWNINQSKAEKAYKNGINYTDKGLELCWGIEYGSHTYTINYTINNLVWQYDDMQIMYFSFLPQNMDPAPQKFNLTISGYKEFTDLKYSSYGFNSTNSIQNGKIYFNSKDSLASSDYVVALVGFPNKTFNLVTIKSGTYSDVANEALEGATLNSDKNGLVDAIIMIIMCLCGGGLIFAVVKSSVDRAASAPRYENEVVLPKMKEVNNFRDIPFDKNIFYAYWPGIHYKLFVKNNLIGAILLKWLQAGKINMVPTSGDGFFDFNKADNYYLDLTNLKNLDNKIEDDLAKCLKEATQIDGLTPKHFSKWCRSHYQKMLKLLDDAEEYSKQALIANDYMTVRNEIYNKKKKSRQIYTMKSKLHEQTQRLQGLKKFLEDMTLMDEKKAIEVHLWNEYLIFAELFGNADKVAKQFREFHALEYQSNQLYYDNLFAMHIVSHSFVNAVAAAEATQRASGSGGSFSGGGSSSGGFSSGGGGVR